MKDFPGTPGTLTGLLLRILQCVFAAGSIISMATSSSFFNFTAFCYLIASMGLQVIWSFVLLLLDAYSLMRKKVLNNHVLVSLFVVGDWVTATLSLGAASASGGIVVLYFSDLGHCSFKQECLKYQLSVTLAFLSWLSISLSSLIMLWILAADKDAKYRSREWSDKFDISNENAEREKEQFLLSCLSIPLSTILLAMVAYFVLAEKLHLVCYCDFCGYFSFLLHRNMLNQCIGLWNSSDGCYGKQEGNMEEMGQFFSHIFASFHHYITFSHLRNDLFDL